MFNARSRDKLVTPKPPTRGKEIERTSNCSKGSRCSTKGLGVKKVRLVFTRPAILPEALRASPISGGGEQESNLPGDYPLDLQSNAFTDQPSPQYPFFIFLQRRAINKVNYVLRCGQLLGIEPKAVEPQSTILPLNYSCQRTRYRARTDTPKEWLLRPPCLPFHQAGEVPWGRLELPKT